MEYESQGYTTSDSCPRNNTHKVKKLIKGNRQTHTAELQKTALHTARVLQKVLEV